MSKAKKQKEAEEFFNGLVHTGDELSLKDWKNICVEMFKEGYWSGVSVAQDKMQDLIAKLDY